MIPIHLLHPVTHPLMTIILLVPHILMILHLPPLFPLRLQTQRDQRIHRLPRWQAPRRILLFLLINDLRRGSAQDLRREGAR